MPDFNRVRGWVCDGTRGTQADKAHDLFVELRHDAVDARAEDPIGPEYGPFRDPKPVQDRVPQMP